MTEKQNFINYMKVKGFKVYESLTGTLEQVTKKKKTPEGHHVIIKDISCSLFDGVNTKNGDIGCVSLYYIGQQRDKYCKYFNEKRILQHAFCPKNAKEAISIFEYWKKETQEKINIWENE